MSHELVVITRKGGHTVAISSSTDKLKDIQTFIMELIVTMEQISYGCTSDGYHTADFDKFGCICGVQDHSFQLIPLTNANKHDI